MDLFEASAPKSNNLLLAEFLRPKKLDEFFGQKKEVSKFLNFNLNSLNQNLILWDNIKIYHSGHLYGTFSAFNPYITDAVKFIHKGTDAQYGDRVSSVIAINTANLIPTNFHGGIGINGIEADTYFETPVIVDG